MRRAGEKSLRGTVPSRRRMVRVVDWRCRVEASKCLPIRLGVVTRHPEQPRQTTQTTHMMQCRQSKQSRQRGRIARAEGRNCKQLQLVHVFLLLLPIHPSIPSPSLYPSGTSKAKDKTRTRYSHGRDAPEIGKACRPLAQKGNYASPFLSLAVAFLFLISHATFSRGGSHNQQKTRTAHHKQGTAFHWRAQPR